MFFAFLDADVGEFKWRRLSSVDDDDDDDDVDEDDDESTTKWSPRFTFKEKKGENVLVIKDVALEDEAVYECQVL